MLTCLAFVAMAQTLPSFATLERGSVRLETGHISTNIMHDRRTFLKKQDNAHFYLVESTHGPMKRYVEKVPQRGLPAEFCGIMNVEFENIDGTTWSMAGNLTEENGGQPVTGLVDTSRSYFFNHVWVSVPGVLHFNVTPLPSINIAELDLTAVTFCEEGSEGFTLGCSDNIDLSHLKN